ncbi:MAG: M23 family metallopeptidase [Proteobacteria bacterium]|nr:M23 family metallopeptidase [Pseudomonadota bacterium]
MHIILVSDRLATAKSLTLSTREVVLAVTAVAAIVVVLAASLAYFGFRHAAEIKLPFLESLLLDAQHKEKEKEQSFVRENLNAMAVKLGQMQAQLMRLDALGERLSVLSGVKPQEFRFNEQPGRGGAVSTSTPPYNFTVDDFSRQLNLLSRHVENRTDHLDVLESQLFDAQIKKKLMPTVQPIVGTYNASSFGWRPDPITGQNALHEGVDFIADIGTPIYSAAGGVVVVAEMHPQYGNLVEIDHGNDFTTRYAHASRLLVKAGDLIQRGKKIAEVGNTGRSTGPHLHFEVRFKGVAQNPARFLQQSAPIAKK